MSNIKYHFISQGINSILYTINFNIFFIPKIKNHVLENLVIVVIFNYKMM
jgi:hypothetical protein